MVSNASVWVSSAEALSKRKPPGVVNLGEDPKADCRLITTCVLNTTFSVFRCYWGHHAAKFTRARFAAEGNWQCEVPWILGQTKGVLTTTCSAIDSRGDLIRGIVGVDRRCICSGEDLHVLRIIRMNRFISAPRLGTQMNRGFGVHMTAQTVMNRLLVAGYIGYGVLSDVRGWRWWLGDVVLSEARGTESVCVCVWGGGGGGGGGATWSCWMGWWICYATYRLWGITWCYHWGEGSSAGNFYACVRQCSATCKTWQSNISRPKWHRDYGPWVQTWTR